jgi:hypothetical protein
MAHYGGFFLPVAEFFGATLFVRAAMIQFHMSITARAGVKKRVVRK